MQMDTASGSWCIPSEMFRCASRPLGMRQCFVRLASALVHEAWHFEHGRSERDAYEAQIAFLLRNGVFTAGRSLIAAERRATNDAPQRFARPSEPVGPEQCVSFTIYRLANV